MNLCAKNKKGSSTKIARSHDLNEERYELKSAVGTRLR